MDSLYLCVCSLCDVCVCVLLVVGTIGEKLADNPDLFLSQDGGVTWIMVRGEDGDVHVHGVYVRCV